MVQNGGSFGRGNKTPMIEFLLVIGGIAVMVTTGVLAIRTLQGK